MPFTVKVASRGKDDWQDQGTYESEAVAQARAQAWRDAGRDADIEEAIPAPAAEHPDLAALQARIAELEAEKARQDAELETIRGAVAATPAVSEVGAPTAPEAAPVGESSAGGAPAVPPTGSGQ